MSKTDRILEALMGGDELTAKQMKSRCLYECSYEQQG